MKGSGKSRCGGGGGGSGGSEEERVLRLSFERLKGGKLNKCKQKRGENPSFEHFVITVIDFASWQLYFITNTVQVCFLTEVNLRFLHKF